MSHGYLFDPRALASPELPNRIVSDRRRVLEPKAGVPNARRWLSTTPRCWPDLARLLRSRRGRGLTEFPAFATDDQSRGWSVTWGGGVAAGGVSPQLGVGDRPGMVERRWALSAIAAEGGASRPVSPPGALQRETPTSNEVYRRRREWALRSAGLMVDPQVVIVTV